MSDKLKRPDIPDRAAAFGRLNRVTEPKSDCANAIPLALSARKFFFSGPLTRTVAAVYFDPRSAFPVRTRFELQRGLSKHFYRPSGRFFSTGNSHGANSDGSRILQLKSTFLRASLDKTWDKTFHFDIDKATQPHLTRGQNELARARKPKFYEPRFPAAILCQR